MYFRTQRPRRRSFADDREVDFTTAISTLDGISLVSKGKEEETFTLHRLVQLRPEQLDRRVRDDLNGHVIPSTQDDLPLAANFFVAAKGPDGSLAAAGRQASYDGPLGARGQQSLQSYGQDEPVYDNNAYTITSIYHGGTLKMYTSHPAQPTGPGGRPEYFMNQLKGWSLTSDPETFR